MISKRLMLLAAVAIISISPIVNADSPPAPQPGFALTIYSNADPATFDPQEFVHQQSLNQYYAQQNPLPGYGVVRENRQIDLDKGENTVRFTDVATGIDPTTVSFESLTAPNAAAVLEQNYEYDLVSGDKLLGKYIGKEVKVMRRGVNNAPSETVTGNLLSFDASSLVLQNAEGKVQILTRGPEIEGIELASSDATLITKPTLVWKIRSTQAGQHLARVTYQTDSLTWRADYNVTVNPNDNAADIGAWVTILNQSGAAYPDARLKLVAGDVQRIKPPPQQIFMRNTSLSGALDEMSPGFSEKSFFEYHLYTLGRTTTLGNNSTKQIELFAPKLGVPVDKTYVYYGTPNNCDSGQSPTRTWIRTWAPIPIKKLTSICS
jgi:hypothetical protein